MSSDRTHGLMILPQFPHNHRLHYCARARTCACQSVSQSVIKRVVCCPRFYRRRTLFCLLVVRRCKHLVTIIVCLIGITHTSKATVIFFTDMRMSFESANVRLLQLVTEIGYSVVPPMDSAMHLRAIANKRMFCRIYVQLVACTHSL